MLVVFSEINSLPMLNNLGVFPDEFYTDFEEFKNSSTFFRNATVVCIFAGHCYLHKRQTIFLLQNLMARAESETDTGINNVVVVSDITLPQMKGYYKYRGSIYTCDLMNGYKVIGKNIDMWSQFKSEEKKSICRMSSFDLGSTESIKTAFENRDRGEDEYIDLIVVPTF